MKIGGRQIGAGGGGGVYVIAELGVNHDGSGARAMELVEAAHGAGADAIKLQYFQTDLLMSKSAKLAAYQKQAGETDPIAMLRRLEMPIEAMRPLVERAHALGMHAIVTVFSMELVDGAEGLAWDAYKTASPDIVHKPLLERLARTGKPLIVSTGASTPEEITASAGWLREWGADGRLGMLQCVSSYPTPCAMAELGGIGAIHDLVGCPVGYSDHTPDEETGAMAVRGGATMLEKHLTYSRIAKGPDHAASLEPDGLGRYVELARHAAATGERDETTRAARVKRVLPVEEDVRRVSRQSVVAMRTLGAGHVLAASDLTIKRPGTGIPAAELGSLPGRRLACAVEADTVLLRGDLA